MVAGHAPCNIPPEAVFIRADVVAMHPLRQVETASLRLDRAVTRGDHLRRRMRRLSTQAISQKHPREPIGGGGSFCVYPTRDNRTPVGRLSAKRPEQNFLPPHRGLPQRYNMPRKLLLHSLDRFHYNHNQALSEKSLDIDMNSYCNL